MTTKPKRQLLFSVTSKDFKQESFSVGGHGGSGKDTSNSGVRLIHLDSGAVGEGREHRTNSMNKKSAFHKLIKSKKFLDWHKIECAKRLGQHIAEIPKQILTRVDKIIQEGLVNGDIVIDYQT